MSIPKGGLGNIPFSTSSSRAFLVDSFLSSAIKYKSIQISKYEVKQLAFLQIFLKFYRKVGGNIANYSVEVKDTLYGRILKHM
jgi:hypothetical protein